MPANKEFAGWKKGRGDATHASTGDVLEMLVPGDQTETHSRQIHMAQAGDAGSDWGLAANAHPMFVLHSTTTPTTDYVTFQHDGTNALINSVGGNMAFQINGTTEMTLTACGLDVGAGNLKVQSGGAILDNCDNQLILFPATVACAVNEITVSNAVACSPPSIAGTGCSTNVGLTFDTKAAGQYNFQSGGVDLLNLHDASGVAYAAATDTAGHTAFFQTEDGGIASAGTGGVGGTLQLLTGDGGAGVDASNRAGGAGGSFTLITGAGGAASACTTGAAGSGGLLCLAGGVGGIAASSCSGNAGAGGAITLTGGVAGAISGGTGTPGVGGVITVTGGIGSTSNVACDISGAGGAMTFASGAGGTGTGAGASGCGGAGGAYTISAGVGGASTSGGGGNGGTLELFSGQGGVGTGCSAGGCAGDIKVHIGTAVEGGAVGAFVINNNTTGLGTTVAVECTNSWTAGGVIGQVSHTTAWAGSDTTEACTGVLVIKIS